MVNFSSKHQNFIFSGQGVLILGRIDRIEADGVQNCSLWFKLCNHVHMQGVKLNISRTRETSRRGYRKPHFQGKKLPFLAQKDLLRCYKIFLKSANFVTQSGFQTYSRFQAFTFFQISDYCYAKKFLKKGTYPIRSNLPLCVCIMGHNLWPIYIGRKGEVTRTKNC